MRFKIFLLFILLGIIPSCGLFEEKEDDCIDESKISGSLLPDNYTNPVCGCDGRTYRDPNEAEVNGVTKWEMGFCPADSIRLGIK